MIQSNITQTKPKVLGTVDRDGTSHTQFHETPEIAGDKNPQLITLQLPFHELIRRKALPHFSRVLKADFHLQQITRRYLQILNDMMMMTHT